MADPSGTLQLTPISEHALPVIRFVRWPKPAGDRTTMGIFTPEQIDYMLAG